MGTDRLMKIHISKINEKYYYVYKSNKNIYSVVVYVVTYIETGIGNPKTRSQHKVQNLNKKAIQSIIKNNKKDYINCVSFWTSNSKTTSNPKSLFPHLLNLSFDNCYHNLFFLV